MYSGVLRERIFPLGRPFLLFLASDCTTLLALMVGQIAIPWWIAEEGGAFHLALYAISSAVGLVISLPLMSPLGDRYCKRGLIGTGLVSLFLTASAVAAAAHMSWYGLPLVLFASLGGVLGNALIFPASASIAAQLLPASLLTQGLAVQKIAQSVGRLAGPAIAGVTLAVGSTSTVLGLYAVLLGGAIVLTLRIPPQGGGAARHNAPSWLQEFRAGIQAKWSIPLERGWTLVSFVVVVLYLPGIGMLLPLRLKSLGLSGAWLGACEVGLSVGMVTGAAGLTGLLVRRYGRYFISIFAVLCIGACFILVGVTNEPLMLIGAFVLIGISASTAQLVGQAHRILATPAEYRSRMLGIHITLMQIGAILGPALSAAGLNASASVQMAYAASGGALLIAGFGYAAVPGYRAFIGMTHEDVEGYYGRAFPRLFSRLTGC